MTDDAVPNRLHGSSVEVLQYVPIFLVLVSPDLDPALQMWP